MILPLSLAIAFSLGIMGYAFIYCVEKNVKVFNDLLSPKTRFSKKNLYMITAINFGYFGLGCALLFFHILKF
jgi:sugar phosphate permease